MVSIKVQVSWYGSYNFIAAKEVKHTIYPKILAQDRMLKSLSGVVGLE